MDDMNDDMNMKVMQAFLNAIAKNEARMAEREKRVKEQAHEAYLKRQAEAEAKRKEEERWNALSPEEKEKELAESRRIIREALNKTDKK